MSKPKAPKAPDIQGLATQQNQLNQDAANYVTNANRYGQSGPTGSNEWITGPDGKVTNQTTLSPEQQQLYSKNNALAQQMAGITSGGLDQFTNKYWGGSGASPGSPSMTTSGSVGAGSGIGGMLPSGMGGGSQSGGIPGGIYAPDKLTKVGGVGGDIQRDLDYSKLAPMPTTDPAAARQQAQDALYGMQTQYLDPQMQAQQKSLETKLSNMGLVPGTPAYNRAMQIQMDASQKAYGDARLSAIAGGGAEQERAQNLALQLRNQGKSEVDTQGAFHNTAQGQRAGQLLTDIGQQRQLEGTLAGANAQVSAAGINAGAQQAIAEGRLGLDTRSQAFNELMGMYKNTSPMIPQFGTSQGNMTPYQAPNVLGAEVNNYQNQLAQYNAKRSGGVMGMIPGALGAAGTYFGGPVLGAAGKAIGNQVSDWIGG